MDVSRPSTAIRARTARSRLHSAAWLVGLCLSAALAAPLGGRLAATVGSIAIEPQVPGAGAAAQPPANTTVFTATADAYVASGRGATTNYGSEPDLRVGSTDPVAVYRSLVRFEGYASEIPSGALIDQATLTLEHLGSGNSIVIEAQALSTAWTESGVTWNDQPTASGHVSSRTVGRPAGTYDWDVTTQFRLWFAGTEPDHGLVLRAAPEDPDGLKPFLSREAAGVAPPVRLEVVWRDPPTPTSTPRASPSATATATATATAPSATPTPSATASPPDPTPTATHTATVARRTPSATSTQGRETPTPSPTGTTTDRTPTPTPPETTPAADEVDLTYTADVEPPLCPYGHVTLWAVLRNSTDTGYTGMLEADVPQLTAYVPGSASGGGEPLGDGTRVRWRAILEPKGAITVTFGVSVTLGVRDGTALESSASAQLSAPDGQTLTRSAIARVSVDCRTPAATPHDLEVVPPGVVPVEHTPVYVDDTLPLSPRVRQGAGPEGLVQHVSDVSAPGWEWRALLPVAMNRADRLRPPRRSASASAMESGAVVGESRALTSPSARPHRRGQSCDAVPPWATSIQMTEDLYVSDSEKLADLGYRPISITASGDGASARFSTIWVKDGMSANNWILRHKLTTTEYVDAFFEWGEEGYRPIVLDAYGDPSDPRYAAIWTREPQPPEMRGANDRDLATMVDLEAEYWSQGFRPLWYTGLPNDDDPRFSGLWIRDAYTGTGAVNLTASDLSADGLAQGLTDDGFRLQQISGYDTPDGRRYAATWVKDSQCPERRWEGFRNRSIEEYVFKAMAQTPIKATRVLQNGAITIKATDFATRRYVRLQIDHELAAGSTATMVELKEEVPGVAQDGDIVVLNVVPRTRVRAVEGSLGNLRLRPWKPDPDIIGQPFLLDSHQYRLVLEYDADSQRWVERWRNDMSPDYYYPIALDDAGATSDTRYASVWLAGPTQRQWRSTSLHSGAVPNPDPLADFDTEMRRFMERRGITNGALAVAKDGRLVVAKAYTWDLPEARLAGPYDRYRMASVAKPLTSVGILRLVQSGQIGLDDKLKDVPGFDAEVLDSDAWVDARIKDVTIRQLLHHIGGWDRDASFDPMLEDWQVCEFVDPDHLPTAQQTIIDWMRSRKLDHKPGIRHAYSNFGYNLLGRITEVLTGKAYGQYMQDAVFGPIGMGSLELAHNTESDPAEVFYHTPNNTIAASRLGFPGAPAERDICDPDHADVVPDPYGGLNLPPMDSHGGWIAAAPDLARFLVNMESSSQVLNSANRGIMWSRPNGRSRRVALLKGIVQQADYTIAARTPGTMPFPAPAETDETLVVGTGLQTFGKIDVEISTPGQGYDLKFFYTAAGGFKPLTADDHGLVDATDGFTQDGVIRFEPPKDWGPNWLGGFDEHPRYAILIQTTAKPAVVAELFKALPSGEQSYGLGWTTTERRVLLAVAYGLPAHPVGSTIVGSKSKAAAVVQASTPLPVALPNAQLLEMDGLVGGPFYPGENLFIGNGYVGKALGRDRAVSASASHGGLLWGTRTWMVHRSDNVNWVLLLNQDNHGAFYLPRETFVTSAIDGAVDGVNASGAWPVYDLFP